MTVYRNEHDEREYHLGPRLTDEQVVTLLILIADELIEVGRSETSLFYIVEDKLIDLGWIEEDPELFADETIHFVGWWYKAHGAIQK